jgi:hypothetical protein
MRYILKLKLDKDIIRKEHFRLICLVKMDAEIQKQNIRRRNWRTHYKKNSS